MQNKDKDTEKELKEIAENACLHIGGSVWKLDQVLPVIQQLYSKMLLMVDSRYGTMQDIIRISVDTIENTEIINGIPASLIPTSFLEMIFKEAKYFSNGRPRGKLIKPIELTEGVSEFYDNGYDQGLTIPEWQNMSQHYRIAKRELTTITGIPGHGKSEFMDAIMIHLAQYHNWRIAVYSPENYPFAVHMEKFLSKKIGKPFHQGRNDRMSKIDIADNIHWLNEHFVFIEPDEENINLESILALTLKANEEKAIDAIIIDPWNELEHNRPTEVSETEYIGLALSKCRRYARYNNFAFWIVAHPHKLHKQKDSDIYDPPDPYSISGSAHWRNKSDNCLCVFRNNDNTVSVYIQKIKYKVRGQLGVVNFYYDKITGIYTEKGENKNELPK